MRFGAISARKAQIRDQINERKKKYAQTPEQQSRRRIAFIGEKSQYYKYRQYIIGKLVEIVRYSTLTNAYVCRFVHNEDRQKLNNVAGWTADKEEYMFENIKFKEQ